MPVDARPPEANAPARGTVCAGGFDTAYEHAGRGTPLIVFARPHSPLRQALLTRLSGRYWVVAPDLEHPLSVAMFTDWLREFLEALTPRPAIFVAAERWIAQLLSFALLESERTSELVLVLDATTESWQAEPIAERLEGAGVPVLLTWCSADTVDAALDCIERRLESRPPGPAI